jgi:hypothetical protein
VLYCQRRRKARVNIITDFDSFYSDSELQKQTEKDSLIWIGKNRFEIAHHIGRCASSLTLTDTRQKRSPLVNAANLWLNVTTIPLAVRQKLCYLGTYLSVRSRRVNKTAAASFDKLWPPQSEMTITPATVRQTYKHILIILSLNIHKKTVAREVGGPIHKLMCIKQPINWRWNTSWYKTWRNILTRFIRRCSRGTI